MKARLRHELFLAFQYFVITVIALVSPYLKLISGPDHINIFEAWKNIDSYVKSVLLVFVVIAAIRLLLVAVISFASTRPPRA
jgi:hypothetical protein